MRRRACCPRSCWRSRPGCCARAPPRAAAWRARRLRACSGTRPRTCCACMACWSRLGGCMPRRRRWRVRAWVLGQGLATPATRRRPSQTAAQRSCTPSRFSLRLCLRHRRCHDCAAPMSAAVLCLRLFSAPVHAAGPVCVTPVLAAGPVCVNHFLASVQACTRDTSLCAQQARSGIHGLTQQRCAWCSIGRAAHSVSRNESKS